jgi:hypothetical protein
MEIQKHSGPLDEFDKWLYNHFDIVDKCHLSSTSKWIGKYGIYPLYYDITEYDIIITDEADIKRNKRFIEGYANTRFVGIEVSEIYGLISTSDIKSNYKLSVGYFDDITKCVVITFFDETGKYPEMSNLHQYISFIENLGLHTRIIKELNQYNFYIHQYEEYLPIESEKIILTETKIILTETKMDNNMKKITYDGVDYLYEVFGRNDDWLTGTNIYSSTETETEGFWIFKKQVPKYLFSIAKNIEHCSYTKENIKKFFKDAIDYREYKLKEAEKCKQRNLEIQKGEIL